MKGGAIVRSGRGGLRRRAHKRAGDELFSILLHLGCISLAGPGKGVYIHVLSCSERGSRVNAAGDRPHGVVTIGGDELNGLWSV